MDNPSYAVLCGVGAALCIIAVPWHLGARDISTLIFLGWVSTACLLSCVNAILWAGNVDDKAPVLCDISSRFYICLNTGIISSGLCIQRRLYRAVVVKQVSTREDSNKRELIINLLLGVGLPALMMPLYYVVQSLRYVIVEDIGCRPAIYPTYMGILMFSIWPVLVSSASFIYGALTIRAIYKNRRQFSKILSESGADLNFSRFFRLMALAATDMIFSFPLSLYFLISGALDEPSEPYSWANIHEYINEIGTQTREDSAGDTNYNVTMGFSCWSIPGAAILFFLYFGLSGEAIRQYKRVFWRMVAPLGFKPSAPKPKSPMFSWIKRRPTGVTTTCQDLMGPAPAYTTDSKAEKTDDWDEKVDIESIRLPPVAYTKDLESQTGIVEEHRERDLYAYSSPRQ